MYRKFVVAGGRAGCEYGDMTPNCERVRQNPGLCYIPENRYLCCDTCSNIRVTDNAGKLLHSWTQVNCYVPGPRTQVNLTVIVVFTCVVIHVPGPRTQVNLTVMVVFTRVVIH